VVTSLADGQPLAGATVVQEGTANETVTDRTGEFLLTLPPGSTVTVSAAGHAQQTVTLRTGQTLYRIRLRAEEATPEERLWEATTVTADEMLQGRIAGVQVFRNSYAPGAVGRVSVHGSPGRPLYVVDGMPWQEGIEALAPSDIVGMEVVKDAADLALYGTEGYTGVILITTRSGKAGATTLTYDGALSAQETGRTLPHLNLRDYAASALNNWTYVPAEFLDPSLLGEGTDWQKEIFRRGLMQTHQMNLRGGTERLRLAASSGWTDQEGTVAGSDFSRFHARLRLDGQVNRYLRAGASLSFAQLGQTLVNEDPTSGVLARAIHTPPYVPVYRFDGTWGGEHPLWQALTQSRHYADDRTTGALYAEFTPVKGLTLRSEYGFEEDNERFGGTPSGHNSFWRWRNRASYVGGKGRHHTGILAGFELMSFGGYRGNAGYGNLRYDYDKRYFAAVTLRADRPHFSAKTELMHALSLAWSIADESFLRGNIYVSTLRLHAGLSRYGAEAGLEAGFLEDRFTVDVDVFDQVYPGWIPDEPVRQGIDVALRTVNVDLPSFRWTSALNATFCSGPTFGFYNTAAFRGIEARLAFIGAHSLEPADFIRIPNVSVGYSFPAKLLRPLSLGALKIEASVQNPYVFTGYGGFDPETGAYGYPPYRAATLALHVRF
jgi:hypothetical protein